MEAAVAEAAGRLALAEGDPDRAAERLRAAVAGFERAGQPLDVERASAVWRRSASDLSRPVRE